MREYSINRVITFTQITKGVFADLTRRELPDEQAKMLLAFLRLPFFRASASHTLTAPLMSRPLDSIKVMLFFILYTGRIHGDSLKRKRAALIKLIFGDGKLVIDKDSDHLFSIIFNLFMIPTIVAAQSVICDFGFANKLFPDRELDVRAPVGVLIKDYY